MAKRLKTARPTLPNVGVEAAYRRRLDALIDRMNREASREIIAAYASNQQTLMAQDEAGPTEGEGWANRIVDGLLKKWEDLFDRESQRMATWFVGRVTTHSRRSVDNALKDAGLTVKLTMSPASRQIVEKAIDDNAKLISKIPEKQFASLRKMIDDSVKKGRDLGGLTKGLEEEFGMTRRRAVVISRDQNNKATEALTVSRYKEAGITEAIWMHRSGSKQPRESHLKMNGQKFNLAEGLYDEDFGDKVMPGQLVNCRCTCRAVIPEQPKVSGYAGDHALLPRLPILGSHRVPRRIPTVRGYPPGVPRGKQTGHGQQPLRQWRVADSARVRVPSA